MLNDNLGPLPKSDRNDDLQEKSFRAFSTIFPPDQFRVRLEQGKDAGVDRYLEVKIAGCDTNLRSQVQLKGVDNATPNKDGSLSKSIEVSNFNYLLNGPCPMYVLYVAQTGELYFAWARDEVIEIEKDNPVWMSAQTITIRFKKKLDASALSELQERIIRDERLSRRIHEHLVQSSRIESTRLEIDPSGMVTDPVRALELLQEAGATIIAAGFPDRVIQLFSLLNQEQKHQKRVLLIVTYAHFMMGKYDLASGYLRECRLISSELNQTDEWLFKQLANGCEYKLGEKSYSEYSYTENKIGEECGGVLGAYIKLEALRQKHSSTRKGSESRQILRQMEEKLSSIREGKGTSPVITLSSEVIILYSQGHEIITSIFHNIAERRMQARLPTTGMPSAADMSASIAQSWQEWDLKAKELINRTIEERNPILVAEAHYASAATFSLFLVNIQVMSEIGWIQRPEHFTETCQQAIVDIGHAIDLFKKANCLESEMRAQLILCDFYELCNEIGKVTQLSTTIQATCIAMGYDEIARNAERFLLGHSHLSQLREGLKARDGIDSDIDLLAMSDDDARECAETLISTMGLLPDRLPNILDEINSHRSLAAERRDWCRHIMILQRLGHEQHVDTAYANPSDSIVQCNARNLRGENGSDWSALVKQFKMGECAGCSMKVPKGTAVS